MQIKIIILTILLKSGGKRMMHFFKWFRFPEIIERIDDSTKKAQKYLYNQNDNFI